MGYPALPNPNRKPLRFSDYIIPTIIALIVLGFLIYLSFRFGGRIMNAPNVKISDTTIIINNYYDTNIYLTKIVQNPIPVFVSPAEKKDSGLCDSVRMYKLVSSNDSVEVFSTVNVQGKLLNYLLSYRLTKPYYSEKIITVSKTTEKFRSGFLIGSEIIFYKNDVRFCPFLFNPSFSGKVGYEFGNGWGVMYGYDINKSHSVEVFKHINYEFFSLKRK